MAIKALPTVSNVLYLQDLVPGIAALEGDCAKEELAYVIVRQGTESDSIAIERMSSERQIVWTDKDVREVRDSRMREQWAMQVFRCMCDAGNITGQDDKAVFEFSGGAIHERFVDGTFGDFLKAYGALNPIVTRALRYAVWEMNPDWDLRTPEEGLEGEQANS
ncbi:MAG TPA: hypothetical protein VM537_24360 [Anaerolineae bacterium]|nr:hypothetical protein [Anaerolineae bacterium]